MIETGHSVMEPSPGQADIFNDWQLEHAGFRRRERAVQQQLRSENVWINIPGAPNLVPADPTAVERVLRISTAFYEGWITGRIAVSNYDLEILDEPSPGRGWTSLTSAFSAWLSSDAADVVTLIAATAPDRKLQLAIRKSRRILKLKDNWDDQGSHGYTEDTWNRAVDFLRGLAVSARTRFSATLPVPSIGPAESGSIDFYWEMESADLLINFPQDPNEAATYYGERGEEDTTSGTIGKVTRKSVRHGLISWLLDQK